MFYMRPAEVQRIMLGGLAAAYDRQERTLGSVMVYAPGSFSLLTSVSRDPENVNLLRLEAEESVIGG